MLALAKSKRPHHVRTDEGKSSRDLNLLSRPNRDDTPSADPTYRPCHPSLTNPSHGCTIPRDTQINRVEGTGYLTTTNGQPGCTPPPSVPPVLRSAFAYLRTTVIQILPSA